MVRNNTLAKVALVSFPKKSSLNTIWAQFESKLCNLMSLAVMSHDSLSKSFEMQYDGVQ